MNPFIRISVVGIEVDEADLDRMEIQIHACQCSRAHSMSFVLWNSLFLTLMQLNCGLELSSLMQELLPDFWFMHRKEERIYIQWIINTIILKRGPLDSLFYEVTDTLVLTAVGKWRPLSHLNEICHLLFPLPFCYSMPFSVLSNPTGWYLLLCISVAITDLADKTTQHLCCGL